MIYGKHYFATLGRIIWILMLAFFLKLLGRTIARCLEYSGIWDPGSCVRSWKLLACHALDSIRDGTYLSYHFRGMLQHLLCRKYSAFSKIIKH